MFTLISVLSLIVAVNFGDGAIINSPRIQYFHEELLDPNIDLVSKWVPPDHIMDFINLIDVQKVLPVAMKYIQDPEVKEFVQFVTSPKMLEIIKDFESIEEFLEAVDFFESKGYRVKYIINAVNSILNLPPVPRSEISLKEHKGMVGFIQELIAVMPVEEMQELFISKLESSPEVAELYNTITSEEFKDIVYRMLKNPKYMEIRDKLESYGFGYTFVCSIAQGLLGDNSHDVCN